MNKLLYDLRRNLEERFLLKKDGRYLFEKIKKKNRIKTLLYEDFLNEDKYYQVGGDAPIEHKFHFKRTIITKISPSTLFQNINFENVTFEGITLDQVCFHNCSFKWCKFENMQSTRKVDISKYLLPDRHGFSACDFFSCSFKNCDLNQAFFCIASFKLTTFENVHMFDVLFQMSTFSQVEFTGKCDLQDMLILSPSHALDILFGTGTDEICIDDRCFIGDYQYGDMLHVNDISINKIMNKVRYEDVSRTYYSFSRLLENNKLRDSGRYYYLRKKADTRAAKFPKNFWGRIGEYSCGYGEKPWRAFEMLFFIVLVFALIYGFIGVKVDNKLIDLM